MNKMQHAKSCSCQDVMGFLPKFPHMGIRTYGLLVCATFYQGLKVKRTETKLVGSHFLKENKEKVKVTHTDGEISLKILLM